MTQQSRRTAFTRLAGSMTALAAAWTVRANAAPEEKVADDWPGPKKTPHRLVVDGYTINGGAPLHFAANFVSTNSPAGSASVVLVLRSTALPMAMASAIWAKYRIGEAFKIIDPDTKAPAVKNPFLGQGKDATVDGLLAHGAVIGACDVALQGTSRSLASNAGVSGDEAAREWAASLVPGIALLPSGVWGVGRAQEAGCGYCAGG